MARINSDLYRFSHTEISTFKECRRKWWLQYYLKLRRKSTPVSRARDTGVLVHGALEIFYKAGGQKNEEAAEMMYGFLAAARDEDMLKVSEDQRKDIVDIHRTSEILARGYVNWLEETGADLPYDFDSSEREMVVPGPVEGTEMLGIIDLGGTHKLSNNLFVMDTKVVASIDDTLKILHMNEQAPTYAMLALMTDEDPDRGFRVVWNMIKRNKQTARSKPPFYQRYELAINADQLRQYYLQLQGQMEEILRLEDRLNAGESHIRVAFPTPTKDCTWKCPYFALCGQMNDVTHNDINWTINQYFTTPEQRKDDRLESDKQAAIAELETQEEGS